MKEPILCPWCGREMRLVDAEYYGGRDHSWYICDWCSARSPDVGIPNAPGKYDHLADRWTEFPAEVHDAALRRYTPMRKPLTLAELMTREHAYIEYRDRPDEECHAVILRAYQAAARIVFFSTWGIEKSCMQSYMFYNDVWRLWAEKPTDEERRAAEWNP